MPLAMFTVAVLVIAATVITLVTGPAHLSRSPKRDSIVVGKPARA
jgi:hypothetical protein